MIALDEHSEQWSVEPGDPAYRAARLLLSLGFAHVVLPLSIILTGKHGLSWPSAVALGAQPDEKFLHYARLLEQAQALESDGRFC